MDDSSLRDFTLAALANADSLILEACLLGDNTFYARGYFLSVAAIEEVGKAAISHQSRGRNLKDPAVVKRVSFLLSDHHSKIRGAFIGFLTADPEKNLERSIQLMIQLQQGREPSMYSELRAGERAYRPTDSVTEKNFVDCVRLAQRCRESIGHYVRNTDPPIFTASDNRLFAAKKSLADRVMNRSDFWWYWIDQQKLGERDFSKALLAYETQFSSVGKTFKAS